MTCKHLDNAYGPRVVPEGLPMRGRKIANDLTLMGVWLVASQTTMTRKTLTLIIVISIRNLLIIKGPSVPNLFWKVLSGEKLPEAGDVTRTKVRTSLVMFCAFEVP